MADNGTKGIGWLRGAAMAAAALTAVWTVSLALAGEPLGSKLVAPEAREPVFGNTAGRQQDVVETLRETNAKLDEIIKLLKSGEVTIRLQEGEKPGGRDVPASKPR